MSQTSGIQTRDLANGSRILLTGLREIQNSSPNTGLLNVITVVRLQIAVKNRGAVSARAGLQSIFGNRAGPHKPKERLSSKTASSSSQTRCQCIVKAFTQVYLY